MTTGDPTYPCGHPIVYTGTSFWDRCPACQCPTCQPDPDLYAPPTSTPREPLPPRRPNLFIILLLLVGGSLGACLALILAQWLLRGWIAVLMSS